MPQELSIRLFGDVASQLAQGRLSRQEQCEETQECQVEQGK